MKSLSILRLSLRSKLLLSFAMILLIPSFAIGMTSYETAKSKVKDDLIRSAQDQVETLDDNIMDIFQNNIVFIGFLSRSLYSDSSRTRLQIVERLDEFRSTHSNVSHVLIGTVTGDLLASPRINKLPEDYDPRKTNWYEQAMSSTKAIITEPYKSVDNNIVVTIAQKLSNKSGVIAINIDLRTLQAKTNGIQIGKEGFAFVLDDKNHVISFPSLTPGSTQKAGWTAKLGDEKTGNFRTTYKGKSTEVVYRTNPITGWKTAGMMMSGEASDEASPIFMKTWLIIGIALLLGALSVIFMLRSLLRPLRAVIRLSEKMSQGDMRERAVVTSRDEIGKLGMSFNAMGDALRGLLTELAETSHQLASSSQQLTANAEQTAKATEQIADSVQAMSAGMDKQLQSVTESSDTVHEMSEGFNHIAASAESVFSAVREASDKSAEGGDAVRTASEQMTEIHNSVDQLAKVIHELNRRSKEIGSMIGLISGIAKQTNMLALNAAIEASRAGEQGRGFAVVAQEVRKLAEQSGLAANQVGDLIHSIQLETELAEKSMEKTLNEVLEGRNVVGIAGELFEQIESSIRNTALQVEEVSAAARQLSAGTVGMVQSMELITEIAGSSAAGASNVSSAAQEQLASMEEVTSSAASLSHLAEELQLLTDKFKV